MKRIIFALFLAVSSIFTISTFTGCSSASKHAAIAKPLPQRDLSQSVAKILARNALAPLVFKDAEAVNHLTASISETSRLKFAVVLNRDSSSFSKYFVSPFDQSSEELIDSIQSRVRNGATEITYNYNGMVVSVVPIRSDAELLGYAAVGSL
jgi:hypothetical protein